MLAIKLWSDTSQEDGRKNQVIGVAIAHETTADNGLNYCYIIF
jgi:hypothetical protein